MARIVTKAFTLNLPDGHKSFNVGDKLEGAEAGHWYAQAFSDELAEAAPVVEAKPKGKKAAAAAEEAAPVVEAAQAEEPQQ